VTSLAHGRSAPDACSVLWDNLEAPAYGTASVARFWVALEQEGPWGRDAARESHLAPDVGDQLTRACADAGGRLILVRRPGVHPDRHTPQSHRVFVAWSGEAPWLLSGTVADPAELLHRIDPELLGTGDREAALRRWPELAPAEPVLLVCTNAKRDVCCAVRGRPVAAGAAERQPGRVWECSHTGGHRFAPTGILLPHGQTLARLDTDLAAQTVDAAADGQLPRLLLGTVHDRGRSALPPQAQAAESFVRAEIGETDLTALATVSAPSAGGRWLAGVTHDDGRHWSVEVRREVGPAELPASCGKGAAPVTTWHTTLLAPDRTTAPT
jgi:hypothetical protein